ncbi:MAG: hypothetical protein GC191_09510 [Azospirillum sp.]|nr:hypothetical protein [Azospirillum sp.]
MAASIHRIEQAMQGKIDFLKGTDPWRRPEPRAKPPLTPDGSLDRAAVAARVAAAFRDFAKKRAA